MHNTAANYPPQYFVMEGFRTALVALAGYIYRHMPDLEIKLVDLSTTKHAAVRDTLERAIGESPGRTFAGISTLTADYQSALKVANELKLLDRDIVNVLGRHHASADASVILRNHQPIVDYVICGEGEIALYQLIRSFPAVEKVPGLAFLIDGQFRKNAAPALLSEKDLDLTPLTFEGWELAAAPGKFEHVTYVSARGCPLSCAFCAVANQTIRAKSIPQVIKDVRELVGMGYKKIAFEDNFFAHNRQRTRDLCGALAELRADGVTFTWDCQTRVESMDHDETLGLMERSGCEAVYLGVESLHENTLRFLEKTHDPLGYLSRVRDRVIPRLLASDIDCYINLQFGIPGEYDAEIEQTVRTMEFLGEIAAKRGRTISVFPQLFVVYPGTSHFKQCVGEGLFPDDVFETFTAWEVEQRPILTWLGATFAHGAGGVPVGILEQNGMSGRKYTIDEKAVMQVIKAIDRVDQLSGVSVFQYGNHLVKESCDVP